MFSINNLFNNANMQCINQLGQYRVFEHQKDLSVSPYNAETAYFSAEMNVRRRQVLVELNNTSCKLQAGAMQWMLGNVSMQSGVSAGNFLGKALGAAVTGETMSKPEYTCLAVKTTTRYWWTSEPKINAYNRPFRHITDTVLYH